MTALRFASVGAMALAGTSLFACSPAVEKCPTFTVAQEVGKDGAATASFTLSPTRDGLSYNWTTSAGTITSGQGTAKVVISDPTAGEAVTASVEIGGLDTSCTSHNVSATATMP
jgi:hypothetical protein